jgi:hypothetical protein
MKIERQFWANPDSYLAAVQLGDKREQAYAIVKDNLALIKSLPPFETGYHFYDVVKVTGPSGQQKFKDDFISVYKAVELHCPSDNYTFQFQAIISNTSEYFHLQELFSKYSQSSSLVWKTIYGQNEWNLCFCSAKHLAQARVILEEFMSIVHGPNSNFQFKELKICT